MRFLLNSLCIFLFFACGSYPKKQGFDTSTNNSYQLLNPYFSNTAKDYVYRANIDAFQKSFGGIFVVKKIGDAHHRIVFTTEMGNTLFDFEFLGEEFSINRILPEMDKKVLINVLKTDFLALTQEHPIVTNRFRKTDKTLLEALILSKKHYYLFEKDILKKVVRTGNGKEKVTFVFSGINDNIAKKIEILHYNIPLSITLTAL